MRTFHTVKAEEIIRIDGLNDEYDFKQNNREASMTPAERLQDHAIRRETRPVEPVVEQERVYEEQDGEVLTRPIVRPEPVKREEVLELPPLVKFTLTGGEIKQVPENEILVSEGVKVPSEGDYLIESYDIWTDKSLFKVYDKRTFDMIFKASLS